MKTRARFLKLLVPCVCLIAGVAFWLARPGKKISSEVIYSSRMTLRDHSLEKGSRVAPYAGLSQSDVLRPVVDQFHLDQEFSSSAAPMTRSEAIQRLKQHVTFRFIPNTSLVEIEVRHSRPEWVKKVAERVQQSYRERRIFHIERNVQQTLEEMRAELDAHRGGLERLKAEAEALREEGEIADPDFERSTVKIRSLRQPPDSKALQRYLETKAKYLANKPIVDILEDRCRSCDGLDIPHEARVDLLEITEPAIRQPAA